MIKHADNFKSPRLSLCRWLIAFALGCLALNVFAQTEIPFNTPRNSIEYKASGNTYTWQPVPESTPKSQQPYRPDLSGGSASTAEPRFKFSPELPYEHKGGTSARNTFSVPVDPRKASNAASKAASAAAAGMSTGNGYLAAGMVVCAFVCEPLMQALVDWGLDQLKKNEDGTLSALVPDPAYETEYSDGSMYRTTSALPWAYTKGQACRDLKNLQGLHDWTYEVVGPDCVREGGVKYRFEVSTVSSCSQGSPVTNGVCGDAPPKQEVPLETYLDSKYTEKGWDKHWAKITAGLVAAGHNVFSDGTSGTIIGPRDVPLGTTEQSWPVNVIPGTTTEAPAGHTGATDPGTKTSTTTKTATNTYSGNQQTTSTGTSTSTKVTNNITNNTSTSVTTNTTQSDDAPKEKEEKSDHCKENKDTLGCAELDEVQQDLPQKRIDITYEYTSLFGNGSCPADKHLTTHYGQSLKVWDWQVSCDHIVGSFQPVLLICCAFAGFVIVAMGAKE